MLEVAWIQCGTIARTVWESSKFEAHGEPSLGTRLSNYWVCHGLLECFELPEVPQLSMEDYCTCSAKISVETKTIGGVIVKLSQGNAVPRGWILPRCLDLHISKCMHSGGIIPDLERSGMSNPLMDAYPRDRKLLFHDSRYQ